MRENKGDKENIKSLNIKINYKTSDFFNLYEYIRSSDAI